MSDEYIAGCCFHVAFRCLLAGIILVIDWLVMRRKESIISNGRYIQDSLHLPETLQIFAKTDPGMQDRQLHTGSHVLVLIWLSQALGLLAALGTEKVWSLAVLIPGLVVPLCLFCILYLWLVISRRNFLAAQRLIEVEGECLRNPGDKLYQIA